MKRLNFPAYDFRIKNSENKVLIFDVIRKKFVVLQPEEWVRQHVLHFLMQEKNYPASLINVEKQLVVSNQRKRYDLVVYNQLGTIEILVECKAPEQPISQASFDQIARYNMELSARYLLVTNGLKHYFCRMNLVAKKYEFLPQIPDFSR